MLNLGGYRGDDSGDALSLPRMNDKRWCQRLGQVAGAIGSRAFHQELIDLFGSSIRCESCWIIRYSCAAAPEVVFTNNVADEVVGSYSRTYSGVDPFSHHWKRHGRAGVVTLSQAKTLTENSDPYTRLFLPKARISDEMAVFLPTIGTGSFGFFLEREQDCFSKADVERAKLIFPIMEGYHRAHIGWVFNDLRNIRQMEASGLANRPMLIQDRFGAEVYSNDAWNDAMTFDRTIMTQLSALPAVPQTHFLESFILRVEPLARDFPLAPAGRVFVLEPRILSADDDDHTAIASNAMDIFTPREREILSLIMRDFTTGQIAQALQISKGTIKNHRLRMYRKADVASERALIKKFLSVRRT